MMEWFSGLRNQNSRPIKGREEFPAVPPLLVALTTLLIRQLLAIGSQDNAWVAFRASSGSHIHPDSSGGNFAGYLPGGGLIRCPHFPVGFAPATFLFQSFIVLVLLSAIVGFCQDYPIDSYLLISFVGLYR
jgi:hypothetical protein